MSGHFCITVDLPLYEDPADPAVHESSDRDNFAQSNYDKFWSESGSPSTRKRFSVKLENPTAASAIVFPRIRQTSPFYRVYIEHSWLRLGPQQTKEVGVMMESLDGDPAWEDFVSQHEDQIFEVPGIFEISGWVQGVCAPQCTGGATVEVRSGKGTRIKDVRFDAEPGAAGVVLAPDGSPATNGVVLMTMMREGDYPVNQLTATSTVDNDGTFFVYAPELESGMLVGLLFLGGFGFAPCETELLRAEFD